MSELQASVRSREKLRLENEKAEAEEKERVERELRQSVGWGHDGKGGHMSSAYGSPRLLSMENTILEVGLWRKQREASLKGELLLYASLFWPFYIKVAI
jgi:hypothetical protein